MVEFLRKFESRGIKSQFESQIYKFTLILDGVGVRCDRGRFSVLYSPFIEKSMSTYLNFFVNFNN